MNANHRNGTALTAQQNAPVNRLSPVFDRLFDDFFAPIAAPAWTSAPLAMWEDENHVYVEMDAPGLTADDIEVSIHSGDLIIQGERKCQRRQGGYDTRSYGRFEQRMTLPAPVDAEKVEARLVNGVLSLTCAKSEEAKPRRIAISTAQA
jgi:HSP20 family protein